MYPVRNIDGALITKKGVIFKKWYVYAKTMLNKIHAANAHIPDDRPKSLDILIKIPSFNEVKKAILCLKYIRSACLGKSLPRSSSMADALYIGGCIFLSLNASPLNVSRSN